MHTVTRQDHYVQEYNKFKYCTVSSFFKFVYILSLLLTVNRKKRATKMARRLTESYAIQHTDPVTTTELKFVQSGDSEHYKLIVN